MKPDLVESERAITTAEWLATARRDGATIVPFCRFPPIEVLTD